MQKFQCDDMDYFPFDMMFTTRPKMEKQLQDKFESMLIEHKVKGNLRWGEFRKYDSALSQRIESIYKKIIEGGGRYTKSGAYPPHLKIASARKKDNNIEMPTIPGEPKKEKKLSSKEKISLAKMPSENDTAEQTGDLFKNIENPTDSFESTKENLSSKEKAPEAIEPKKKVTGEKIEDLMKIPPKEMSKRQVKMIINQAELNHKAIIPYYKRLQELKSKPVNYNKPPHVKTAKSLITKVFSGKANPSIWAKVEYDKIMKSKLYSIKMGIEYLKETNPEGLDEVLQEYQPKIDMLLKKLKYNSIDDIKF